MDALARRRRPLLIGAALATAVVACGARGSLGPVGQSDKVAGGRTPVADAGRGLVDGAGALPADYRATFTKLNKARFVSRGHADQRWEMDVWANDVAAKAIASRAREVPAGATVVAEHFELTEGRPKGPIMVMEKREPGFAKEHGDWRWVVVGSRGQLVHDGVIESCAGCHDDAPMDGFFPIVE